MIRLLLYDLDGTLIDSRRDIANAVNWTLGELGFGELPMDKVSAFVGSGVKNLMSRALEEVGAPLVGARHSNGRTQGPPLQRSIKLFRRRYGDHLLEHTVLYPSVKTVLDYFKDRKQAVITNKPEDFSLKILKGLGIASYFFKVLGGDSGFPKKPAPAVVLEVLRLSGISPKEALLIGDSAIDVETGRAAGIQTAVVTSGFSSEEELKTAQPDLIFRDLKELIECPLLK